MTRITCPRCHGDWYRDIEPESGKPYSCFRCGNTGTVEAPYGGCPNCGAELQEGEAASCEGMCEDCYMDAQEGGRAGGMMGDALMRGQHER